MAKKLRDNPEYTKQLALMASQTTDLRIWLCNLVYLWSLYRYEVEVGVRFDPKTGEALETEWVVEKSSVQLPTLSLFLNRPNTDFISPELHTQLVELVDEHEIPIVIYVNRYVTIDRCHIQTGGGHNDSASYAPGIKIRLCHNISI